MKFLICSTERQKSFICEICEKGTVKTLWAVCLLYECVELSTFYRRLLFPQFANSLSEF